MHSQERVDEGVVEENSAIPGEVDETKATKKAPKDAYYKKNIWF